MESPKDFLDAYTLGKNHGKPHWLERDSKVVEHSEPYCILRMPEGIEKVQSLAHLLPTPTRQKGSYVIADTESFIRFVLSNRDDDQSVVWCNESFFPEDSNNQGKAFICCVFNENTGKVPGWRDFYCWMITAGVSDTEAAMKEITTRIRNVPIYKGMPDVKLPESLRKINS